MNFFSLFVVAAAFVEIAMDNGPTIRQLCWL
jgi:hypothetical protein